MDTIREWKRLRSHYEAGRLSHDEFLNLTAEIAKQEDSMTTKITAHITIDGEPICQRETHWCGLLGVDTPEPGLTCTYESLAAAHRAKRRIQRHRSGVRVVRGECPKS